MASKSRISFDENIEDISHLVEYFKTAEILFSEDPAEEIPPGADVVLRSAVVLLVTYWEAYIEDITKEAIDHLIENLSDSNGIPKQLKQQIAKELKADKHELAIWSLADSGWKTIVKERLDSLSESRNRTFNTPKSSNTRDFIKASIGIDDITKTWKYCNNKPNDVCAMLDIIIEIRGHIAHRGKLMSPLDVGQIDEYTRFIKNLVSKTGGRINTELKKMTGVPLWRKGKG